MIDISQKPIEEINSLILKYKTVLEVYKYQEKIPYLAYIYEIALDYINSNYISNNSKVNNNQSDNDLTAIDISNHDALISNNYIPIVEVLPITNDIRAWTIHVLTELLNIITNEIDVENIVDEFINYYNSNYSDFVKSIVIYNTEYDRDWSFAERFIKNEKNNKLNQ